MTAPAPESVPAPVPTEEPTAPVVQEETKAPATMADTIAARRSELAAPPVEEETEETEATEDAEAAPAEGEATEEAPAEEAEPEGKIVKLLGRRPEDPEYELEVADQEAYERLNQTINAARRVRETDDLVREAERQRDEAEALIDQLRIDPLGTIEDRVDPASRADLILHLLSDQLVFEQAQERLALMLDPETGAKVQAELWRQRNDITKQNREALTRAKTLKTAERETYRIIDALVPEGLEGQAADYFLRDAENDIRAAIATSPDRFVHPRDVPRLLVPRLRLHGMTDDQITARLQALARGERPPRRDAAPVTNGPRRVSAKPAKPSVEQLRTVKRTATAGPSGAGAPATPAISVPKNMDIRQAIEHRRRALTQTPI